MEDYEILKELGSGIQGKTYLARYLPSSKLCCLKEIECKDNDQAHNIFREMLAIRSGIGFNDRAISLPFCMFINWDTSIASFFFYQAFDYYEDGNLQSFMNSRLISNSPVSEKEIRKWIGEMIIILQILKSKKIVHRCVRPSNFFFGAESKIVLTDICCSYVKEDTKTRTRVSTGCLTFSAPEIVVAGEEDSYNTDFWSFGAVILGLLGCFRISYSDFSAQLIEYNFSDKALDFIFSNISQIYSSELLSTIKEILCKDKKLRINLDNLNDYLKGILNEIDLEKQTELDGILVSLDITQPLPYYISYLKKNYKSRICFREVLNFFNENISEEWSLFSFDEYLSSRFLSCLLYHVETLELCSIGMKILGIQAIGLSPDSDFFGLDKLSKVCMIAEKYPLCKEIQYATANIFHACRDNNDLRTVFHELKGIKIFLMMMKNFSSCNATMTIVMKAMWPMMLYGQNSQDVHEEGGCGLVVKVLSNFLYFLNFFKVSCLNIFGISLCDANVIDLNAAGCIPVVLNGLSYHRHDTEAIINACNVLSSMTDAEEESAYIMATAKCGSDKVAGIVRLGQLIRQHMDSQPVVETILKVFWSLCRHDDILSAMRCSGVGEAIDDVTNAYIDTYDVHNVCMKILNKFENPNPMSFSATSIK